MYFSIKAYKKISSSNSEKWKNNHGHSPLMLPRSQRPMKKGRKQTKFHNEAQNPIGGSIAQPPQVQKIQT